MKYVKSYNIFLNEGTYIGGGKKVSNNTPNDKSKALTYGTNNGVITWYDKDGNYFSHKCEEDETYDVTKKKYGLNSYKDTGIGVTGSNGEYNWGYEGYTGPKKTYGVYVGGGKKVQNKIENDESKDFTYGTNNGDNCMV